MLIYARCYSTMGSQREKLWSFIPLEQLWTIYTHPANYIITDPRTQTNVIQYSQCKTVNCEVKIYRIQYMISFFYIVSAWTPPW